MSNKILGLNRQQGTLKSYKATAGQLYNYHLEIDGNRHSILNIFLKAKIKAFYDQNRFKLDGVLRDIDTLQRQFFEYENDKPKIKDGKGIFLEGKTEAEYSQKWNEMMQKEVYIIL